MEQKIQPAFGLKGTLQLPPDKSIAHRSAMFAALAEKKSVIKNYSVAADPQSTLSCLKQLGVSIEQTGSTVIVHGVGRDGFSKPSDPIDCGNSGTTMRLLSGIIAGSGLEATLIGDTSLSRRTMKRIIQPLRKMGARIKARDDNYAPLHFLGNDGIKAMNYDLPVASAQLKSCILLAGLFSNEETTVIEKIPSRNHTEVLLGLPVRKEKGINYIISSRIIKIPEQNYTVPCDFSAATFWLVAGGLIGNSEILMPNTGVNPTRIAALEILERMGADIQCDNKKGKGREEVADIVVRSSVLKATNIGSEEVPNCIDEIPILCVAMAFAEGTSVITGAEELRHKECDRLAAMSQLLRKTGVDFQEKRDGFVIEGRPDLSPPGNIFDSFDDHRIAMSAAVLALKCTSESIILNAESSRISYPDFWGDLTKLMS